MGFSGSAVVDDAHAKPRARFAISSPVPPMPMMPIVAPCTSCPSSISRPRSSTPSRVYRSPSTRRRAAASSQREGEVRCSLAQHSRRPWDQQAALSRSHHLRCRTPVAMLLTMSSRPASARSSRSTRSVSKVSRPSASAACLCTSSAGGGSSCSQRRTSQCWRRNSIASPGR